MDNQAPILGLRERKKARAKALIQEQALKLFAKQGYAATTVEQIALVAEVSPSTFFRYFQTKEAVVLYDSIDPIILDAFRGQSADLSVIRALRNAIRQTFESIPADRLVLEMERFALVQAIPELRTTLVDEMVRSVDLLSQMIAERTGHNVEDLSVRNLAGAIIGVCLAALLGPEGRASDANIMQVFDAALERLESGLSLQ